MIGRFSSLIARLYAIYLCPRDALGLAAARPSACDDRVSCIQVTVLSWLCVFYISFGFVHVNMLSFSFLNKFIIELYDCICCLYLVLFHFRLIIVRIVKFIKE